MLRADSPHALKDVAALRMATVCSSSALWQDAQAITATFAVDRDRARVHHPARHWHERRPVRRDLRRALALVPGLDPADWTPRELRHSFVSLLSDEGVPLGDIAQLVGHSGTTVTELVYRHQIRPVIQTGATVMDRLFGHGGSGA